MIEVIIGFLGCGGIALIVTYFMKYVRGDKTDVIQAVHDVKQKFQKEKIKEQEKAQKEIEETIKKDEVKSKESIEKIKNIKEKAQKEIEEVIKEDNIKNIKTQIDSDWGDI